jgi:hypothetical protein
MECSIVNSLLLEEFGEWKMRTDFWFLKGKWDLAIGNQPS